MPNRHIARAAVLAFLLSGEIYGQEDISSKLSKAISLERQGMMEEAVKLYEELHKEHPQDQRVLVRLSNLYLLTQRYDELARVCEDALKSEPGNPMALRYLGQAYLSKGDKKRGLEVAERIIELDPKKENSYRVAGSLLASANLFNEAASLYVSGRKAMENDSLFARELAFAYQRNGEYERATYELLLLLKSDPRQAIWVEREIRSMAKRGGSPEVMAALKGESKKREAPPELHRILGDIYLSQGEYEAAAKEYEKSGGIRALIDLGRMAEEEGLLDIAITTYERVLDSSKDEKAKAEASLRIGLAQRSLGKVQEALKTLGGAASQYPWIWGEAQYGIGMIYLVDLNEPRKAISEFEELFGRPAEPRSVAAGVALVECHLSIGDLSRAEKTCEKLQSREPDRATFLLAEIQYYKGDFEKALKLYMEVVERHKNSEVVNDALERVLLIGENQGEGLKELARAELLGVEKRYDEGIAMLRQLIGRGGPSSLLARTTFLMGGLLRRKGEVHQAIGAYRDVTGNYPESPLCPYAKMEIGEIYARELKNSEKGIEELEELLMDYPNSPLSDLVRDRIDELRGL